MSVEAVKSRLHRARLAIGEELAPAFGRAGIAPPRGALCPDVLTLFSQHLEGEIQSGLLRDDGGTSRTCPHPWPRPSKPLSTRFSTNGNEP